MRGTVKTFFANCEVVDGEILKPLSHIRPYWELSWDKDIDAYRSEDGSFAGMFNALIDELEGVTPPSKYHDNEDALAESVQKNLNWGISKKNGKWVGKNGGRLDPSDYIVTLQQGGFHDFNQENLVIAVAGRIRAAVKRGQLRYRDVEESHRRIIAGVLGNILYHRAFCE
jgi:hypothetical protein